MASKSITLIPARRRVGNTVTKEEKPKLRVAAYCRVSTDSEEQASSYDTQVEHYTAFIKRVMSGSSQGYLQMMAFQEPTLKSEKNLIA